MSELNNWSLLNRSSSTRRRLLPFHRCRRRSRLLVKPKHLLSLSGIGPHQWPFVFHSMEGTSATATTATTPTDPQPQAQSQVQTQQQQQQQRNPTKIDLLLKATGNAPIIKQKKWAVDQEKDIAYVISFLRNFLKLKESDSLFLYINQTFSPSPDHSLRNLYECFGADGKLVLHYAITVAWG